MSMQTILAASQSMTRMQTMQSAHTQMQGQVNILRSQSKQDGGDEKKEAQAEALEEKSSKLMDNLMSEATDINETLRPDEEVETDMSAKKEAEEVTGHPKTDTIELSDAAAKHISMAAPINPVVGKAMTYKPDGSTAPSTSEKSVPVFKTIA